jgi:hypothetical protein
VRRFPVERCPTQSAGNMPDSLARSTDALYALAILDKARDRLSRKGAPAPRENSDAFA